MVYEYNLTFAEYKAAQRLFNKRTPKQRFNVILWLFVMPIVGIIAFGVLLRLFDQMIYRHLRPSPIIIGLLVGLTYISLRGAIMQPLVVRRMFKDLTPDGVGNRAFSFEFTGTELISRNPGKSEVRYFSSAFSGILEDEKMVLLLISDKRFLFIPKRVMPPEGWAELRAWVGKTEPTNPC
jgi:hypothetical protein